MRHVKSGQWSQAKVGASALLFALLIAVAMNSMWHYESTPGDLSQGRAVWPTESRIPRTGARPTLLMFLHPRCPCSRASIAEFGRVLEKTNGKADAFVLMTLLAGVEEQWTDTALWRAARSLPQVRVQGDRDAVETTLFAAQTSGLVLLYGKNGELMYSGGVTGLRGHVGDNAGAESLVELIESGHGDPRTFPVFGCALADAAE